MLCNICNKNQATVHLTEIIDDQMNELHLCEECARNKSVQMEQQFGLADLLAGLTEFGKVPEEKDSPEIKCPNCGLNFKEFKKVGRLGCSDCYNAFKKYLAPLLKRIHGSGVHAGKAPVGVAKDVKKNSEMQELRQSLQKAIENEQFEDAARIRDVIKDLEKKEKA
ncbi:MAG: UvrB/UvrC motif-containing protein [Candidatus Omnitrophota bacterium]|nr:UvrB/UvrC motif-containing protein [Candidatus Omnitrophota bacterium]